MKCEAIDRMVAERARPRGRAKAVTLFLIFGNLLGEAAIADELVLPPAVEPNQPVEAVYRFEKPATGYGFLDGEWHDVDYRLVEQWRIPVELADATELAFRLNISRAVTMKNQLAVRLSLDSVDQLGNKFHRENRETGSFIASPFELPWWDYQIIMWQVHNRAEYDALKRLGITAGMLPINHASHSFVADWI